MTSLSITLPATLPGGDIIAAQVALTDFLTHYEGHYEWADGFVIRMSPVTAHHDQLHAYLRQLFDAYFERQPIATVRSDPFLMRLDTLRVARQPDLQIILHTNPGQLTETAMLGPADVCIEIVSPGSARVDYGEKLIEYETAGVTEYWIIDPQRQTATFYRRAANGLFAPVTLAVDQLYITPLLPRFALTIPTLWQRPLPTISQILVTVAAQFNT